MDGFLWFSIIHLQQKMGNKTCPNGEKVNTFRGIPYEEVLKFLRFLQLHHFFIWNASKCIHFFAVLECFVPHFLLEMLCRGIEYGMLVHALLSRCDGTCALHSPSPHAIKTLAFVLFNRQWYERDCSWCYPSSWKLKRICNDIFNIILFRYGEMGAYPRIMNNYWIIQNIQLQESN